MLRKRRTGKLRTLTSFVLCVIKRVLISETKLDWELEQAIVGGDRRT